MIRQTHIRFDWALKHILRDKANFGILEGFLTELLGEEVAIEEILESESNRRTDDDKSNRVDILTRMKNGELVIIEIQNTTEFDYFHRILYGTSKAITDFVTIGTPYAQVRKVISISIVYFDLGEGDDYVYKGQTEFVGLHTRHKLMLSDKQKKLFGGEKPADIFPTYYVIKTRNFNDQPKDGLDEWIYFLKNSAIEADFKARGLNEANNKLFEANLRGKAHREYEAYLQDLMYQASMAHTHYHETIGVVEEARRKAAEEKEELRKQLEAEKDAALLQAKLQAKIEKEAALLQADLEKEELRQQAALEQEAALKQAAREMIKKCILAGLPNGAIESITGSTVAEIEAVRSELSL